MSSNHAQLIDRIIALLRPDSRGAWILDAGAERRLASLLDANFRNGGEDPGDVEELLKLVHVLETKHGAKDVASQIVAVMKSVPRLVALIRDQFGTSAHARQAAAALAWFEGRRPPTQPAGPPAPRAPGVQLSKLNSRFDSLEARRAKAQIRKG